MKKTWVVMILVIAALAAICSAALATQPGAIRLGEMRSAAMRAATPQAATGNEWESDIAQFEAADTQNPRAKGGVLFIGSSSIEHWKSLAEDFPGINVINRGFGGSVIADSTYYVDRIVVPYQPKMIVFYAGDNDLAEGRTPQQVFDDYVAFVTRVRSQLPATKIAFISIKPSPARAALMRKMKTANEMIKKYDANNSNLVFIDIFTPMLAKDGGPRGELFGPDGLHMNKEGYRLWQSLIFPYLK